MERTIQELYSLYSKCNSVSIDSRTLSPGAIFFALRGKNHNANTFAREALDKGAFYAVIDDENFFIDDRTVLVENSLQALQDLAMRYREDLKIPVIAITGSVGKTTTKELVRAVLSAKYRTYANLGNLNTHIGVPLTILNTPKDTEMLVVEMGVDHIGELTELCEIAMPNFALVTNVKPVHIEGFKSFKGVVQGKTELYIYISENGGEIIVNAEDEILRIKALSYAENPLTYQDREACSYCDIVDQNPCIVYRAKFREAVQTNLLGAYHIDNISAATRIGEYFGVDYSAIEQAISSYIPNNNRSQIVQKGTNVIVLDAYNANLDSMKGSIEAFLKIQEQNKILILGAIRELGPMAEEVHATLGEFLQEHAAGCTVLLCGESMQAAKNICKSAHLFNSKTELESYVKAQQYKNSAILLKGSRFWALETLQAYL